MSLAGEVIDEDEAKRQSELVERTVNDSFEKRLKEGDPLENKCQRKRVRARNGESVERLKGWFAHGQVPAHVGACEARRVWRNN